METKRVLIVTSTIYPVGGVETMNGLLINFFHKHGYDVDVLSADPNEEKVPRHIKFLTRFFGKPAITAYRYRKLNKVYDIVVCNGEFSLGVSHPKLLNYFHGSFKGMMISQKKILSFKTRLSLEYQALLQYFASFNKRVVTVSDFLKSILEKQGIKTYEVISNPVNTSLFSPDFSIQREDYLFVGSGNYWAKGIDVLESLADRGHKIHCYGRGPWGENLIGNGFTPHEEFPLIYNKYRVLIFPSRFEACSMTVLEALSCGLPVLISEVGIGPTLKKIIPEFVLSLEAGPLDYERHLRLIESDYENFRIKARAYVVQFHDLKYFEERWLELIRSLETAC